MWKIEYNGPGEGAGKGKRRKVIEIYYAGWCCGGPNVIEKLNTKGRGAECVINRSQRADMRGCSLCAALANLRATSEPENNTLPNVLKCAKMANIKDGKFQGSIFFDNTRTNGLKMW